MKHFTFKYTYNEPNDDVFTCEAEDEAEAWKLFEKETDWLEDVEVERVDEKELAEVPYQDPDQLTFAMELT